MNRLFDADKQQRIAERRVHAALAQQHRALRRRLAEVEAGVEHDLLRFESDGLCASVRALEQERA